LFGFERARDRFQIVDIYLSRVYPNTLVNFPHIVENAPVAPFGVNIQARYASSGIGGRDGI
jgi:hypothetical protein